MYDLNLSNSINVVIADDHPLFRKGLSSSIKNFSFINSVFEVSNGDELIQLLKRKSDIKIVFLDIRMPEEIDGIKAAELIRSDFPDVKIIALSSVDDIFTMRKMYLLGCHAYVIKNSNEEDLFIAIETVLNGKKYFDQKLIGKVTLESEEENLKEIKKRYDISEEDEQLIKLICQEKTNAQIADKLCLSQRTIENRRLALYRKMGVKNVVGVIRFALGHNIMRQQEVLDLKVDKENEPLI